MKSIELTEEHKSKLLEMCRVLFPEYEFPTKIYETWLTKTIFFKKKNRILNENIHWFEFCSRYLMMKLDDLYFEKIMNPIDPFDKRNYIKGKEIIYPSNWGELWDKRPFLMFTNNLNGTCYKKHPIDYLYEQFKLLK